MKTAAELFWPRVAVGWTDDCWNWTGPTLNNGYGQFGSGKNKGYSVLAHRASYQMIKGDPGDLPIDHTCRNRLCVNPAHLEAVTHQVNILREREANKGIRKWNPKRATCKRGHDEWYIGGDGYRRCRPCKEARH